MKLSAIKTDSEYKHALDRIKELWDSEPGTRDGDVLMAFVGMVEDYEREHYSIPKASRLEKFKYWLESRWGIVI
jgi:HTH-type transcriptional regulator/antitoxin HigA